MSSEKLKEKLSTNEKKDDSIKTYVIIACVVTIFIVLIVVFTVLNWYILYNIFYYIIYTVIPNIPENYISYAIIVATMIIAIWYIWDMIHISRLQKNECSNMNSLYPSVDGNLRPITSHDSNCSGKLFDYYIKTAYNACSGGSYSGGYVDICVLKSIIKQGVRCLDFEVYSIDNKPVVATSTTDNYHVKETFNSVNFVTVMDTIRNYAFSGGTCPNPTDPILIHLRFKSNNQKMYSKLAKIFESNNDIMLGPDYSYESVGKNLGEVPLLSLQNKVILIVDKTNTAFLENDYFLEYVNLTSNSMFMREYDFDAIENNSDVDELKNFNKTGMTIVVPNKGANPDNPEPKICRDSGCQMVAMRYPLSDTNLKEDILFFGRAGYAFALKPSDVGVRERATEQDKPIELDKPSELRS
jgi:hypothetical protein